MAPETSKRRGLAHRSADLPIGMSGILAVVLIGIGGQVIWVLRLNGSIDLADSLAIEGVIVAVVFGVLALRVALHHDTDLRQVSETLKGVSDSVLTRTVGGFPHFIPHVTALLAQAEESILVMCDNPAYGIVSKGDSFDDYLGELKRQIARRTSHPSLSVEMMFLAEEERRELHRDQVKLHAETQEDWERWRESVAVHGRLEEFLKRVHSICEPAALPISDADVSNTLSGLSVEQYVKRLEEVNSAILTYHFYGAKRYVLKLRDGAEQPQALSYGPSIYFWMRDKQHAIFAIVPLGNTPEQSREIAFETHDPGMIEALRGMFNRYQRAAAVDVTEQESKLKPRS
jgi:hypothetical protein